MKLPSFTYNATTAAQLNPRVQPLASLLHQLAPEVDPNGRKLLHVTQPDAHQDQFTARGARLAVDRILKSPHLSQYHTEAKQAWQAFESGKLHTPVSKTPPTEKPQSKFQRQDERTQKKPTHNPNKTRTTKPKQEILSHPQETTKLSDFSFEEICERLGYDPHDFQEDWFTALDMRIKNKQDRSYLRAPYQTGKSISAIPLALYARINHFPNKAVLVIAPALAVLDQIKQQLETLGVKVGIIDGKNKDFEDHYDIVLACSMTLGKPKHLAKLNPNRFGVVIYDEVASAKRSMGQNILKHTEFLSPQGHIQTAPNRHLLGILAESYDMTDIFGQNARLDNHELLWYISKGHLHEVEGVQRRYSIDDGHWETLHLEKKEHVETPTAKSLFASQVVRIYQDEFKKDDKVMVFCASIKHCNIVASFFNKVYGEGYAYADHSNQTAAKNTKMERAFQNGTGPKILVSVNRLNIGFRGTGAAGSIMTFLSGSERSLRGRMSRIMGIAPHEQQELRKIVEMIRSNTYLNRVVTLPQMFGLPGYPEEGVPYNPVRVINRLKKSKPTLLYKPKISLNPSQSALWNAEYAVDYDIVVYPEHFPRLLYTVLIQDYDMSLARFSEGTGISTDTIERWLLGELPKNGNHIRKLCQTLHLDEELFIKAWLKDALDIIEHLYPIPENFEDSAMEELISRFRKKALLMGEGSISSAIKKWLGDNINVKLIKKYQSIFFNRISFTGLGDLYKLAEFLISTNDTTEVRNELIQLMLTAEEEIKQNQKHKNHKNGNLDLFDFGVRIFTDVDEILWHKESEEDTWTRRQWAQLQPEETYYKNRVMLPRVFNLLNTVIPERSRHLLTSRYGYTEKKEQKKDGKTTQHDLVSYKGDWFRTLEESGNTVGLSYESTRQVLKNAIYHLRNSTGGILVYAGQLDQSDDFNDDFFKIYSITKITTQADKRQKEDILFFYKRVLRRYKYAISLDLRSAYNDPHKLYRTFIRQVEMLVNPIKTNPNDAPKLLLKLIKKELAQMDFRDRLI